MWGRRDNMKESSIGLHQSTYRSGIPGVIPVNPNNHVGAPEGSKNEVHGHEEFDVLPLISSERRTRSGVAGAVFNLATTIIGAGIMALPAAVRVLGLLFGFLVIIVMGIVSEISIEVLVKFSAIKKAYSYGEIVEYACGRSGRVISEICIIIYSTGILIVYLIIMGDVLSGTPEHKGILEQMFGGTGWYDNRKLVIFLVLIVILTPLCCLQKIDSLSISSAISVALAVVFVGVAFFVTFIELVEGKIKAPRLIPHLGSRKAVLDLLVVIPIMSNAYICHTNVQPIYNELEGRSAQKMVKVGRITSVLCVVIYALTAISCYLLFGEATDADVLSNFDRNLGVSHSSAINNTVRITYVIHLMLVFPVMHFSLRQTADAALFKNSAPLQECRRRSLILTFAMLAVVYLGSALIPNIWIAFKFSGTTTGITLGFIFPALIGLRLNKQGETLSPGERLTLRCMLVVSVLVGVIGIVGNVYSIKGQSSV